MGLIKHRLLDAFSPKIYLSSVELPPSEKDQEVGVNL